MVSSHLNWLNSVCYWIYRIWFVAYKNFWNMSIRTERVRNIGFDSSLQKIWTSCLRVWNFSSPRMKPFSKYVTDPLVRSSKSFEPSKSRGKKASNHQKNLTKYSSLQPSFNHQMTFETIVGGSYFRPQFPRFFHRRVLTNDVKFLITKQHYFVFQSFRMNSQKNNYKDFKVLWLWLNKVPFLKHVRVWYHVSQTWHE